MFDNDDFNDHITKNMLRDENGKDKVLCTDINRKNFTYKLICKKKLKKIGLERSVSEKIKIDNLQKTFHAIQSIKLDNIENFFIKKCILNKRLQLSSFFFHFLVLSLENTIFTLH